MPFLPLNIGMFPFLTFQAFKNRMFLKRETLSTNLLMQRSFVYFHTVFDQNTNLNEHESDIQELVLSRHLIESYPLNKLLSGGLMCHFLVLWSPFSLLIFASCTPFPYSLFIFVMMCFACLFDIETHNLSI